MSFLILSGSITAQDIHVSQFPNVPLLRNPALAGVFTGDVRFQMIYRNQWASVTYPYRTSLLSYDQKFKLGNGNDFISTGLTTYYDQAGIQSLKTTSLMPVINYHKSLSQQKSSLLSAGFMAGIINRQFDLSNLSFDNQYLGGSYNAANPTGENFSAIQRTILDLAAGVNYNGQFTDKDIFYAGLSLWHFHQPAISFLDQQTRLPAKWQASLGYRITTAADVDVMAETNYLKQGAYQEWMGGVSIKRVMYNTTLEPDPLMKQWAVAGGLFLRWQDAVIPYAEIQFNNLSLGVSYDVNISKLKTASQYRGGMELSLKYRTFSRSQSSTFLNLRCPRF